MEVLAGSTIAVLCYARKTGFAFHDLATDLSKSLWHRQEGAVRLDMPDPDFALCDLTGMRIGIARVETWREFPGSLTSQFYPECVLISVGPNDTAGATEVAGATGATADPARFARVRQGLVARVQDVEAADRVLLYERAGTFDAELFDALVDDIRAHLDDTLRPRRAPVVEEVHHRPAEFDSHFLDPVETPTGAATLTGANAPDPEQMLHGLASRVERELARLEEARKVYEAAESAAERRLQHQHGMRLVVPRLFPGHGPSMIKLFTMPGPRLATAGPGGSGHAYPDYDHMPANVDERPLLHRAAVNALNIAVMTVALPVGAALLTMSVFGREDMLFSSRVTAVTGTVIGIGNTGLGEKFLSLFS